MSGQKQRTVRLFTLAQFGIIFLFTILTIFSLIRLTDVRDLLLSLTQESVPVIAQTSLLNNQIQSLATLTNFLAESNSEPEKRLAKRKIDDVISNINLNLTDSKTESQYLTKQLNTVYNEIDELEDLVGKRIVQEKALIINFNSFYDIVFTLFADVGLSREDNNIENNLLKILLLSIQIDHQTRLHELRKIEQDLKIQIKLTDDNLVPSQSDMRQTINSLQLLVIGNDGLVNQKIESLRVTGRTRGRDSFVRNLIADVASNLQYQSQAVNRTVSTEAFDAAKKVSEQTTFAIWAGLTAVLITLGIIYFLYQRIVVRLLSLATQVSDASQNSDTLVRIDGNDEIADLAQSFSVYLKRVRDQEKALLYMTLTDPLTTIPNRRAFDEQIKKMIALSLRNEWDLTILLIDIDFFKPYNDHYGHSDGDACLRLVASQLNNVVLRNTDFCARYGGEEFVCLLPNTGADGAKVKAEALRVAIENMQIPHTGSKVSSVITVSVGAATFPFSTNRNWTADIVVQQADKALYQAKADGRNRCSYFSVS
ncbi:MAG: diguanylate cyclase (GGDEF)-like protein [Alphaproteobacteria bacterium]|jgi:diguanylate cyclase (GGDEF)-like protein